MTTTPKTEATRLAEFKDLEYWPAGVGLTDWVESVCAELLRLDDALADELNNRDVLDKMLTQCITERDQLRAQVERLQGGEAVLWQYRTWYGENTANQGWGEWVEVTPRNSYVNTVMDSVREIQRYISSGYKYELRALYTAQPAAPAMVPLTDEQIIQAMTAEFPTPSLVPMLKGSVICGDFHKALVAAVNVGIAEFCRINDIAALREKGALR